jgi:hypothetical protein
MFQSVTSIEIKPNHTTPKGYQIDIDLSKYPTDFNKLDERITKTEECLIQTVKEQQNTPQSIKDTWMCLREPTPEPFNKKCLRIKVVDPIFSKCSDWQFIDVLAPQSLCEAKGLPVNSECPCRWRTSIQGDNWIITPPTMYLWELGRIYTSCNNIWNSPYAKCLNY